jgi:hypothetical protein
VKAGTIALLLCVVGILAGYVWLSGPFINNGDMKILAHKYKTQKSKIKSLIAQSAPECLKATVDISWPREFVKMAAETTDDVVAAMSVAGDNATREQIDDARLTIAADRSYAPADQSADPFKEFDSSMKALNKDFQKLQSRYLSAEPRVMACIAKSVASYFVEVKKA